MDDVLRMRRGERVRDGSRHPDCLVDRQATAGEPGRQRLAIDQFHHQVVDVVMPADVVERADMGMAQAGDGAGLALEAQQLVGTGREPLRQELDRHGTIEPGVEGAIDLAHPAGAEQ